MSAFQLFLNIPCNVCFPTVSEENMKCLLSSCFLRCMIFNRFLKIPFMKCLLSNCFWRYYAIIAVQLFLMILCNVSFPTVPENVMQCVLSTISEDVSNVSFPTGSEDVMQCFLPLFLRISCNVSFQLFLRISSNVSYQLFLRLSCNVSFQLFLKVSCNVSYQLFLTCHAMFPSNWSLRRHAKFPSNCSWDVMNISFQLVLKMSCNLFFLSWRYAVSFPYCADSTEYLFSIWYLFHANIHYMFNFWSFWCHISNIFKLISMSQSRKSVR